MYEGSSIYGGFPRHVLAVYALTHKIDATHTHTHAGPLGTLLKKNLQDKWWRDFVVSRMDCGLIRRLL